MSDRAYSTWQLPTYQVIGPRLRVHWDSQEEPAAGGLETGEEMTYFSAAEAVFPLDVDRTTFTDTVNAAGGPGDTLASGWFPPEEEEK